MTQPMIELIAWLTMLTIIAPTGLGDNHEF